MTCSFLIKFSAKCLKCSSKIDLICCMDARISKMNQAEPARLNQAAKFALTSASKQIIMDLVPKFVIDDLLEAGAISSEQRTQILKKPGHESQAELLIQLIRKSNMAAFEQFKKNLLTDNGYTWLAKALQSGQERFDSYVDHQNNMMSSGGVPQLPPHMFRRRKLERLLQEELKWLFRGPKGNGLSKWVVTWGKTGEGKTVLMASSLRDPVLLNDLGIKHIFWVKLGTKVDEGNLLIKMHTLCEKMDDKYRGLSPMSVEMAASRLRGLFATEEHMNSLLVLDDVWQDSVIRHFDFGGRVLVSTRDRGIMEVSTGSTHTVDIGQHGLSLEDTCKFFAQSLNVNEDDLPEKAMRQIWTKLHSNTMSLSTACSYFRQHKNNLYEAFEQYIKKLDPDTAAPTIDIAKKSTYEYDTFGAAFQPSYDNLESRDRELFTDLAIFPRDVHVSSLTLSFLWQMDPLEVDGKMQSFIDKSVVDQVLNGVQYSLYNIHDQHYQFLKSRRGDSMPQRHRRLIEQYLRRCDGKFEDLPDDSYIMVYLGHHLREAKMLELFPAVFLDLKVLINKLRVVGPADVLGDFRRYKNHITQSGKREKDFEDFQKFLRQDFHKLSNASLDKVQIALSQPVESEVYVQALALAKETPDKPYLLWNNRRNVKASSTFISTRHHQGDGLSAIFSTDGRFVFSAGKDRVIRVWDCDSGREILRLVQHTAAVNHLCSFYDGWTKREVIMSCSDDRTVRLWRLALPNIGGTLDSRNRIQLVKKCDVSFTHHQSGVVCGCVDGSGRFAVSIDRSGVIRHWATGDGQEISHWRILQRNARDECHCDLTFDGESLVSVAGHVLQLWGVDSQLPDWEVEERHNCFTSCQLSPDDNEIVATLDSSVVGYDVHNGNLLFRLVEPNEHQLTRCAVSPDGSLVAAGTTSGAVVVWSRETRQVVAYNLGHKGDHVHSVVFDSSRANEPCDEYRLVSSDDTGSVIIWKGSRAEKDYEEVKGIIPQLRPVFSVQFDDNDGPCIAAVSLNNKIQVLDGMGEILAAQNGSIRAAKSTDVSQYKINCCALSPQLDEVLYGTSNGALMIFDVKTATASTARLSPQRSDDAVSHCLYNTKGDVKIVAYEKGNIGIWHDNVQSWVMAGHSNRITCLRLFHNDRFLLSCSFDEKLKVWDVATGENMFDCTGHTDSVLCCDVKETENLLLSGSSDATLIIWDACDGSQLVSLQSHTNCVRSCKFSPGNDFVASGDDAGVVQLWIIDRRHISDAKQLLRNNDYSRPPLIVPAVAEFRVSSGSWVHDLAFSPDGLQLVTCTGVIKWWLLRRYLRVRRASGKFRDAVDARLERISSQEESPADQVFHIQGNDVQRVFCSPDFSAFVTIDRSGILYHLSRLPSDQGTRRAHL